MQGRENRQRDASRKGLLCFIGIVCPSSPGRAGGMEKGALMASGAQSDGGDSLFLHQIFT
ncbi:hypothetical protein AZH53_00080 [Methanomicrobiaceae archaeon CYW5]|uniref:hypothetical protein n=1 Tax=Methanovulcanius yangii TaxID=1789227 RepID=UPI0029C9CD07|nr:hypothetical protein [Methanovulcanius yangii]MBT8506831.1 hypothetical protein [Methanovulcanius yangii]